MEHYLLVLLLVIFSSCSNSKTEQISDKKSAETALKLEGVESCNCPEPFNKAEHQIKIPYQENYLKFCAFEYSIFDSTASEFRIFDKNDTLIFPGDLPFVYQMSELKAPLKITQSIEISFNDSSEVNSHPAVEYQILEKEGEFKLTEKFILKLPVYTKQKMDSILAVFKRQPEHQGKYNENDPPFASEEFEMDLFICAINGNHECLQAFENLEERFVTDGAIAELYSELSYLVQVYKKDNNR